MKARERRRPLVTVLIASYDRLAYLPQTLTSVYGQTFGDFEVVVIDDGSRDGTWEWLAREGRPDLTNIRNARNLGAAASLNRGLARCRGSLIAMLDSDDLWRPAYLETMVRCFENPRTMIAFSDYDWIDAGGRTLRRDVFRDGPLYQPAFLALSGFKRTPLFSAAVYRREVFRRVGGYDEGFRRICHDPDLFFRAALEFGPDAFRFVPRSLVRYRRHGAQLTRIVGLAPKRDFMRALLRRWPSLSAAEQDAFFDNLRLYHKCRWWASLLTDG